MRDPEAAGAIHILVIEDDPQIRRFVRVALEGEGLQVSESDTARRGLIDAATRRPDLLVLDLGLPDLDGIDVIRDLRTWSNAPVLVLSARTDEADKVAALDAGADDYLTKPFGVPELLARIRALKRRIVRVAEPEGAEIRFGEIRLDLARREVTRAGTAIHLTPIEYRLLALLASNAGRVLTQRQLLKDVWGPGHMEDGHYLRVFIANLRKKLEADPLRPTYIKTETGVGYRLMLDAPR
ncbi:two-component system response regulator KdpE [Niveibacterium umoris]|uniref:Two-component system KDP operon response regulator KdpE n=1 Tax=Niveibacterium umoris TaxID=1193620 RepID=A0A840BF89_9RHOO|nr:response regulator [Niveibacterium umoris]MBB4011700.1 two-component system KDP operon response regulator KdpE [Niveibacterium umoris]